MAVLISFIIIALLILINGLFVAAEFAIIGVRPSRVGQLVAEGNQAARWVRGILDDRRKTDRYIATAQLGITLASLGLGMYAEPAIAHLIEGPLHDWFGLEGGIVHTISFVFALTVITYLHVVVGEMVPKSLALQNSEGTVLLLTAPMRVMGKLFSIPVTLLNRIGLWTLKLLRIPPPGENSRLYSLDELESIVSESYAEGLLEEHEQTLVANILDFAEERVEQVMVPRTMMTAIPVTTGEEELFRRAFHELDISPQEYAEARPAPVTRAFGSFLTGLNVFFFPAMNSLMADSLPPGRRGVVSARAFGSRRRRGRAPL
jgi:CBS domain containing-hemolysin-like protein